MLLLLLLLLLLCLLLDLLLLQSLLGVIDIIRSDMYTHPHVRYYMREVRLVAYNQVSA
jgi:hypothetical protein